jgi:hypothetical protein
MLSALVIGKGCMAISLFWQAVLRTASVCGLMTCRTGLSQQGLPVSLSPGRLNLLEARDPPYTHKPTPLKAAFCAKQFDEDSFRKSRGRWQN